MTRHLGSGGFPAVVEQHVAGWLRWRRISQICILRRKINAVTDNDARCPTVKPSPRICKGPKDKVIQVHKVDQIPEFDADAR